MSMFWPNGLEISDVQSPKEILSTAQEEWKATSKGVLELVLQDAESESGNSMIIVHAKHIVNNQTAQLFSIVHQPGKPYPVTIQPEKEELPNFLKKSYDSSSTTINSALAMLKESDIRLRTLNNQWISDTPSEFRKNLSDAFNLSIVKREILNLASSTGISVSLNNPSVDNANEDLDDENL